jgi:hypothetical protein
LRRIAMLAAAEPDRLVTRDLRRVAHQIPRPAFAASPAVAPQTARVNAPHIGHSFLPVSLGDARGHWAETPLVAYLTIPLRGVFAGEPRALGGKAQGLSEGCHRPKGRMDTSTDSQGLSGAVRRRLRERRRGRLGLCGVCRRPVLETDRRIWVRGNCFHESCARPARDAA